MPSRPRAHILKWRWRFLRAFNEVRQEELERQAREHGWVFEERDDTYAMVMESWRETA